MSTYERNHRVSLDTLVNFTGCFRMTNPSIFLILRLTIDAHYIGIAGSNKAENRYSFKLAELLRLAIASLPF